MANPIKGSDLYQDDGAIKKAIADVEALSAAVERLKGQTIKLEAEVSQTNVTQAAHRETIRKAATETNKLEKELEKYNAAIDGNNVKIQAARDATLKANQLSKLTAKLKAAEAGSYNALAAQYGINKLRLNQMSAAERKATEAGQELEKQTHAIYQEMKALQEATGKHVLSVGDYEKGTSKLLGRLEQMPGALGGAAGGVRALQLQLKKLLANPIILFIAAIVGGLSALFSAFKQTERGANFMAKAAGVVEGVMTALIGIVDRLTTVLIDVFENPKQALKDFGQLLVDQVVNRFKAIPLLAVAVGKSLKAIWSNDLPALKEAAKDAGQALVQMTTGFDAEQQERFVDTLGKTITMIRDLGEQYGVFNIQQRKNIKTNRELTRSLEALLTKEAVLGVQISDTTKSLDEREKLSKELQKTNEARARKEIQIARNDLNLLNARIAAGKENGRDQEALLDQQLSAYQKLAGAQRELSRQTVENDKEQNELLQDKLERELDVLLDSFDNTKTINEQKIADETTTFNERRKLLEETNRLSNASFDAQIAKITEYTGVLINSNDIINESDAVVLNEKLKALGLSDIITGRLLEAIRDRKSANQDLAKSEQELVKAEIKAKQDLGKFADKVNESRYQSKLQYIDKEFELAKLEIENTENTEAEKTRLILEAEKARLIKLKEIKKANGDVLSGIELDILNESIKAIDDKIKNIGKNNKQDIYDMLGIKFKDDESKKTLNESFAFAKQQLDDFAQKRVDIATKNVESSDREISSAESALQREIENRNAGYANNVQTAEKELKDAKRRQAQALNEQKKAQRAQELIDTASQTSSLITATANIWAAYTKGGPAGPFAAILATATMWGSFIASKLKAAQLTKKQYGEGGFDILGGGSHASGNDTFMYSSGGANVYGERGEAVATINRRNTNKYRPILPTIIDSLNKGTFEQVFTSANTNARAIQLNGGHATDTRKMEELLKQLNEKKTVERFTDGKGRLIEIDGNTKRIYIN